VCVCGTLERKEETCIRHELFRRDSPSLPSSELACTESEVMCGQSLKDGCDTSLSDSWKNSSNAVEQVRELWEAVGVDGERLWREADIAQENDTTDRWSYYNNATQCMMVCALCILCV